jgi:hypothetical protein
MMKSRCVAAAGAELVLLAFALTACGADVTHGTITSKQYVPQSTYTQEQPVYSERCLLVNKQEDCSTFVSTWIPVQETDPECWKLNLKSGKNTGSVCVPQSAWESAKVGGVW